MYGFQLRRNWLQLGDLLPAICIAVMFGNPYQVLICKPRTPSNKRSSFLHMSYSSIDFVPARISDTTRKMFLYICITWIIITCNECYAVFEMFFFYKSILHVDIPMLFIYSSDILFWLYYINANMNRYCKTVSYSDCVIIPNRV